MKTFQTFVRETGAKATTHWNRRAGLLTLCLIIAGLLVACAGGASPPQQAANTATASSNESADQANQSDGPAQKKEESSQANTEEREPLPGTEEFGLTQEELVESIEAVEAAIAACMNDNGFEYVPVDYLTVRKAMSSDKKVAGLSDEEYRSSYGYGISTRLEAVDVAPQFADPGSVVQIGLGEQNVEMFKNLSETDQEAYNFTLFGENSNATFAFTLEDEDFSETGGCTRTSIELVFSPEQVSASYYNPGDALIEQDPRVIEAVSEWSNCMREEGFDYSNPEEVESDLEDRLGGILDGADPEALSADSQAALQELQGEERAIALRDLECEEEFIVPAVEQVETELYGAPKQ